jgi:hypothetical protein
MDIITIHVDDDKAYIILPDSDERIYIPTDHNAVHIHKNFNAKSKIADIQYDLSLYLGLSENNTLIKTIINTIKSSQL